MNNNHLCLLWSCFSSIFPYLRILGIMEGHDTPLYLTLEYGSFINLEELRIRKKKRKRKKKETWGRLNWLSPVFFSSIFKFGKT